ncbi:hypothetical protein CWI38_0436p0020 [Hamiltosporidium tvaerminnensis]|uniref:Uncharacterized protein n=2 Tax=Hamiltosporidium TaxID=1176354 RepID=A0A4V2JW74_9MICR|nr:hypothetical protein LUQ84_000630 [Hamiltosporidium tvaerminnensis]TBU06912.1 hypothetical protein CWI36_0360p0030 [Hamiltosporidium magnivora]TBU07944.1 hypothetical protein CWI39_0247p0030 [Hamiltosporidium magnivora]TBU13418.1 hypothetical protein CWI38_0436p0020 [Hamiltosporidium tvaerminnensis]
MIFTSNLFFCILCVFSLKSIKELENKNVIISMYDDPQIKLRINDSLVRFKQTKRVSDEDIAVFRSIDTENYKILFGTIGLCSDSDTYQVIGCTLPKDTSNGWRVVSLTNGFQIKNENNFCLSKDIKTSNLLESIPTWKVYVFPCSENNENQRFQINEEANRNTDSTKSLSLKKNQNISTKIVIPSHDCKSSFSPVILYGC